MTETTRTVFEKYEVRKSKKQKTAFIDYVSEVCGEHGYEYHVEKGMFGARNIVVGDPEKAKVVYTAHYDTCPRLPFPNFITPKSIGIYLFYQIALVILIFLIYMLLAFVLGTAVGITMGLLPIDTPDFVFAIISPIITIVSWAMIFGFFFAGPANRHTANDNTSGVTTLLDIMTTLPEGSRDRVAFIFFDLEEMGLFGSAGYASKHPKVTKNTLLINFDCVSDGQSMLFALSKQATKYEELLRECFVPTEKYSVEILSKGVFYPSDQANFKLGVGVASLNYSKRLKTLYMDKIHTSKDVVYNSENIEYLRACSIALAEKIDE